MKSPQDWDEMLTLSPMNAQEALRSVRIKPEEIEAIQTDARSDLLARVKELEVELAQLRQDRDHIDQSHRTLLQEKNRIQAECDNAVKCLEENSKGVVAIRCIKHFRVPPYNRNEVMGGECPVCEIEQLQAQLHQRDTALNAAREALASCRHSEFPCQQLFDEEKVTRALSQIQACEVKR